MPLQSSTVFELHCISIQISNSKTGTDRQTVTLCPLIMVGSFWHALPGFKNHLMGELHLWSLTVTHYQHKSLGTAGVHVCMSSTDQTWYNLQLYLIPIHCALPVIILLCRHYHKQSPCTEKNPIVNLLNFYIIVYPQYLSVDTVVVK